MSRAKRQKLLPYVFVDVDVDGSGEGNVVRVHANCTLHTPEWPSKCPWARFAVEPSDAGELCAFYDGGNCHCREVWVEGMKRIKAFVDGQLPGEGTEEGGDHA